MCKIIQSFWKSKMEKKTVMDYFSLKKLKIIVTNCAGGYWHFHISLVVIQMMKHFWKVTTKNSKILKTYVTYD